MNWLWGNCRKIRPLLLVYLDKELDRDARHLVSAHLDSCAACRQLVAELEEGLGWAKRMAPAAPPADFTRKVMARVAQAPPPHLASPWRWRQTFVMVGTAAILLALWLLPARFSNRPPLSEPAKNAATRPKPVVPAPTPDTRIAGLPPAVSRSAAQRVEAPRLAAPRPAATKTRPQLASTGEASAPDELNDVFGAQALAVSNNLQAGAIYEENGLSEEALSAYEKAAQSEKEPGALLAMGRVYEQMGNLDAAWDAYAQALGDDSGATTESQS